MWSIFVQFLYVPVHVFSFPFRVFCLCVVLCLVFHVVCVLFCVLCSMLLVCLDCPFWIAPSVFSNIYLVSAITFLTFQWKRNISSVISFSISNTLLPNIKYPTSSMVSVLVFSIVRALSSRSKSLALLTYSCKKTKLFHCFILSHWVVSLNLTGNWKTKRGSLLSINHSHETICFWLVHWP